MQSFDNMVLNVVVNIHCTRCACSTRLVFKCMLELRACPATSRTLIFIQVLALSHRAQVGVKLELHATPK